MSPIDGGIPEDQYRMDANKRILVQAETGSDGFETLNIWVKAGNGYTSNDLVGEWTTMEFWDYPGSNNPGWSLGTWSVESGGVIATGSSISSEGQSRTLASGSLSIVNSGVVQGTISDVMGNTDSLVDFKLDNEKTLLVGVFTGHDNRRSLFLATKRLSQWRDLGNGTSGTHGNSNTDRQRHPRGGGSSGIAVE